MIYLDGHRVLEDSDNRLNWNLLTGTSDWSGDWYNLKNAITNKLEGNQVYTYSNQDWQGPTKTIHVDPGFYTFSLMMKVNGTLNGTVAFFIQPSYSRKKMPGLSSDSVYLTDGTAIIKNVKSGWNKYFASFNITEEGYIEPRIETSSNQNTILLAEYKLENGTVTTPWMPAIADLMFKKQNGER